MVDEIFSYTVMAYIPVDFGRAMVDVLLLGK